MVTNWQADNRQATTRPIVATTNSWLKLRKRRTPVAEDPDEPPRRRGPVAADPDESPRPPTPTAGDSTDLLNFMRVLRCGPSILRASPENTVSGCSIKHSSYGVLLNRQAALRMPS